MKCKLFRFISIFAPYAGNSTLQVFLASPNSLWYTTSQLNKDKMLSSPTSRAKHNYQANTYCNESTDSPEKARDENIAQREALFKKLELRATSTVLK